MLKNGIQVKMEKYLRRILFTELQSEFGGNVKNAVMNGKLGLTQEPMDMGAQFVACPKA